MIDTLVVPSDAICVGLDLTVVKEDREQLVAHTESYSKPSVKKEEEEMGCKLRDATVGRTFEYR